jgi:hypothetical protein
LTFGQFGDRQTFAFSITIAIIYSYSRAEKLQKGEFMDVYSELKVALGEVQKAHVTKRPAWIITILKNLEHLFGEEVLEYMLQVIGSRLRTGHWSVSQS